jgi:hypothetical protein
MDPTSPTAVLARLADPGLPRAEAELLMDSLDGREAEGVLVAFRWLHDAEDEAELHAAVKLLAHWADRPVAQALPPALATLLEEPGVADLNKVAAADLLAALGHPVDPAELSARLAAPEGLALRAVAAALDAVSDPLALVNFLDALAREPQRLLFALVEDLLATEDPRATAVLAALAQSPDPDLAISAVVALDEFGEVEELALDALALVAGHHPDETVREQADLALAGLATAPPSPIQPATVTVHRAALEAGAAEVLVLVRESSSGSGALTLFLTPAAGVLRHSSTSQLRPADMAELLDRLGAQRATVKEASTWEARRLLDAAAARTLEAGTATALGYAAWPWVLGPAE